MKSSETIHPEKVTVELTNGVVNRVGQILKYRNEQDGVFLFYGEQANVAVMFQDAEVVRVKLFFSQEVDLETTIAVAKPTVRTDVSEHEDPDRVTLSSSAMRVVVEKHPFSFAVYDQGERLIYKETDIHFDKEGRITLISESCDQSHFYGLGEKTGFLDKRGERYTMWNSDVYAPHVPEIDALYVSIPYLIHFRPGMVYGIFLDNPGKTTFDMRSSANTYSLEVFTGSLDMYVIHGPTLKGVTRNYANLTGRMPLPPKWAIGYHQSRYSYMNQEEVLEVARTFREKEIPCDAIYLDIHYMDGYRVFTFDQERFPDPKAMIDELRTLGVRVVPIVDPGVKQDPNYTVYRDGVLNDFFCKSIEGDIFIGEVWPGKSAFPDFTDDKVAKWWGDNHCFYLNVGVSGIWNDMNEPSVFNNDFKTMEPHIMHRNNGNPKTHEELHNLYGMLMSRATYEGLLRHMHGERPFVLTRAAYAGIQRYAAVWTGDNRSFWEHLAMAIPMLLNMGLSGVAFAGADVGGFAHHASGELLVRWTQMGTFFPFFRNHSALDTVRQEPWRFGEEVEEICRKYIKLRYRLMPYLYSLFREAVKTGLPVIRPLVLEYPEDNATYNLCDEFLVGKDLLVAPVYRPDTTCRAVYLPKGTWVNYWSGERISGGRHILVDAPIDTLPLFVRAGAIIPEVRDHLSTDEYSSYSPLVLNVYPSGTVDSNRFVWYEDDGHSTAYQSGAYNEVEFTLSEKLGGQVEIQIHALHRGLETEPQSVAFRTYKTDGTVSVVEVDSLFDKEKVSLK
jgi:alpha-glucosidase